MCDAQSKTFITTYDYMNISVLVSHDDDDGAEFLNIQTS